MVNKAPSDISTGSSQYEYIKCVVVGDSGVGKTCLVRAWACDTKYRLEQLVKTHVSTVWATDHYRNDKEVLDRSWCHVDDCRVSLRLWDTFGYHDKDRGFAYKGADVVLLVFSVVKPNSLRNILSKWQTEIKNECSTTPVVVAGTHADMRFLYKDQHYRGMEKGLLYKAIDKGDIITPDQGREVARMIGAPYYETSILFNYGIEDVFFNVVRAAMVERRKIKFWNTQLRRIQYPLIQSPLQVPQSSFPTVTVAASTFDLNLAQLFKDQNDGDIIFNVRGVRIRAHKICLVIASELFREILLMDIKEQEGGSVPQTNGRTEKRTNKEDEQVLLDNEDILEESPIIDANSNCSDDRMVRHGRRDIISTRYLNHAAFEKVETVRSKNSTGEGVQQTVVTVTQEITPQALQCVLEYLYTGRVREEYSQLLEVQQAAELLKLFPMLVALSNLQTQETYLNLGLEKRFHTDRVDKLQELIFEQGLLKDIHFEVDDGVVGAHKPLLIARCEMMCAMFTDNFLEASAHVIPLPDVTCEVFGVLQEYLYTDKIQSLDSVDQLALIAVANRLCLPHLISLVEDYVVTELSRAARCDEDILEEVLMLIEPSQFHNALQLAAWCQHYVCIHYREASKRFCRELRSLQKENLALIEENQWPPVWYVKEKERYDQLMGQKTPSLHIQRKAQFSRWQQCKGSCFCFCRRSRVLVEEDNYDFPM
ncbi:rho-related BTB domain-containing protein 1-like [Mizuhopecten yessoensis]|uniref:Rho GTPase n=1 Tax=Mizuhopecten yessoensis TaxID=6573 RepID=A0A0N9HJS2_MIZYE|nr:rho-related BTB domain-containing protein 1-like [Mizuhopecten yessoensis]ALG00092.1 Rho GTPase [Mizuhopecten yessoensis]ALG00110.1 Rho GTPase [Mizuhopecten yessoensis]